MNDFVFSTSQLITQIVYWCAALVVLAEALNKLQRTDILRRGMTRWARFREILNALGWACFAIGAGGAWVSPLLYSRTVHVQDVVVMAGLALFVVHRRLKELGMDGDDGHDDTESTDSTDFTDYGELSDCTPELKNEDRKRLWASINQKGRRANDPA